MLTNPFFPGFISSHATAAPKNKKLLSYPAYILAPPKELAA
jgi:hypothetical protein